MDTMMDAWVDSIEALANGKAYQVRLTDEGLRDTIEWTTEEAMLEAAQSIREEREEPFRWGYSAGKTIRFYIRDYSADMSAEEAKAWIEYFNNDQEPPEFL